MRFFLKIQVVVVAITFVLTPFSFISCQKERLDPEVYKAKEKLAVLGHDFSDEGFLKAIDSFDADLVKLYIEAGMGPDHKIKIGNTDVPVIFYALEKGNDLIAQLFIHKGSDINASVKGTTVLMKAVEKANVETLTLMLKNKINVNLAGNDGLTPLMVAIERINSGAVWLLINSGADINKADIHGITPLMRAVRNGNIDIVRELIKRGADVNAVTKNGMKTIKTVGKENREAMLILLKDAGAKE